MVLHMGRFLYLPSLPKPNLMLSSSSCHVSNPECLTSTQTVHIAKFRQAARHEMPKQPGRFL